MDGDVERDVGCCCELELCMKGRFAMCANLGVEFDVETEVEELELLTAN